MNPTTPQAHNYLLIRELKENLLELDKVLLSAAEINFKVGETIIKMVNRGLSIDRISDTLMGMPRWRNRSKATVMSMCSRWKEGVTNLKENYGETFDEVRDALEAEHSMQLTTSIIRDYRGDMVALMQKNSSRLTSADKRARKIEGAVYKAERIAGEIEDYNQQFNSLKPAKLSEINDDRIGMAKNHYQQLGDRFREVVTEYVNNNVAPSIYSSVYKKFIRELNCVHCDKGPAKNYVSLDVSVVPLTGDTSDLLILPACKQCEEKMVSKEVFFTTEDKLVLVFKYVSQFFALLFKSNDAGKDFDGDSRA